MIERRVGDIFAQPDLTHIAHQCNLFHTFGSGIAKEIRERFPFAYEADKATQFGDRQKLGSFSYRTDGSPVIVNLYSQDGIGGQDRQTNYAALGACLLRLEDHLRVRLPFTEAIRLGIPYGLGCGLANGDWSVVAAIIDSAFGKSPVPVAICRLP